MPTTVSGSVHTGQLSASERQAAQNALSKLKQAGSTLGKHLGGSLVSATVPSGVRASGLGTSSSLSVHASDTFMGGARSASLVRLGNDTVVSGSVKAATHTGVAAAQHFALTNDTIRTAGATAVSVHTEPHGAKVPAHTVTLADKTTIKIAGLAPHDISKLHH
jgi:hypothetical protein